MSVEGGIEGTGEKEENEEEEKPCGPYVVSEQGWMPKICSKTYRTTQLLFTNKNGRMITCLRQPRDLYALSKSAAQSHLRWPIEVQMLPQRPYHILYVPPQHEPLYVPDKDFQPPHKTSDISGKVVYDNSPDPGVKYFSASKATGKMTVLSPYYTLQGESDKTLIFESRFECGNLMRAIKVGEYDYQLWVKFDLYTKKYTQWYYFRIQNARPNVQYRFTIMNFMKSGSLYNEGMKPLLYSEKDAREKNIGWIRAGSDIKYYKNEIRIEDFKEKYYYSLHWSCTFPNDDDTYYFAHSYPFTYSDLQEYLRFLANDPRRRKCCKQRVLCQTIAGNHMYVLTITSPTKCPRDAKLKKAIVITARIHPGETVGSWMMKGLLDFLTSSEPDAKILRETFIFKIIPMLNPDGVMVGNYRCSLSGRDLNRNYKTVLKNSFPSVWSTRYLIKRLQEEREVVLYCDFHGHSRKKNVFLYGCENKHDKNKQLYSRIFPMMLSKNATDLVSYRGCRFNLQKAKEGTGRVVMWNLGIRYSYTLEASFCGTNMTVPSGGKEYHFTIQDYEAVGYHFCDTILDFFDPDTSKFDRLLCELQKLNQAAVMKKLLDNGEIDESEIDDGLKNYFCEIESESSCGSDSSMSDGLPMQILHASIPEISRKKRLKSRKERNKAAKQRKRCSITKGDSTPKRPTPEVPPPKDTKKSKPRKCSNSNSTNKLTYTVRVSKETPATDCTSPIHIGKTDKYFENLTYSFVQASMTDHASKESIGRFPSSSSCERCNPSQYYMTYDKVNGESVPSEASQGYSWFEMQIPDMQLNPALEFSRRINKYNMMNGKIPPRMNKMFSVWAGEIQKREELLKRRTLNQGDNADYLRKKLRSISLKENCFNTGYSPDKLSGYDGCYNDLKSRPKTPLDAAAKTARDPKYLPMLKRKKNSFPIDSSDSNTDVTPKSRSTDQCYSNQDGSPVTSFGVRSPSPILSRKYSSWLDRAYRESSRERIVRNRSDTDSRNLPDL